MLMPLTCILAMSCWPRSLSPGPPSVPRMVWKSDMADWQQIS